jgi:putative PEP-CTERM system histidine kinase
VGFIVLSRPRTPVEVNWEVRDLLKTSGRQAASYLAQIQASEALLEAGKFDAFNRMSAFVVHDLKNLVAQLSLLHKNAERHKANPEFQEDMLLTIRHVTDRMTGLLAQLRAGTAPVTNPGSVDLLAVVERVRAARANQSPSVTVSSARPCVVVGHADRLERVIGHLVQNAQDATRGDTPVAVRVMHEEHHAIVEIRDGGIGMSADFIRDRLFKPFQTTKSAGMGIGAYESYQYVTELGGRIDVESVEQQGTVMRVRLPLAGEQRTVPRATDAMTVVH